MHSEQRSRFRAKELAIVMSHYDVGAIREIHSFRRGNVHSPKSVIHTDTGKYILKRRGPGQDDPRRVALSHDIQQYLSQENYPLPKLIGLREANRFVLKTHGSLYELYEFVEGEEYQGSRGETESAAQSLAQLQKLLVDFSLDSDVPGRSYHNEDRVRQSIANVLPGISKHDSVSGQEGQLQAICANLLVSYDDAAQLAEQAMYSGTERIVCHGDWHPGNMLFRDEKVCATFDFDSVRRMSPWEDVANGCLQFSLIVKGHEPEVWPAEMAVDRAGWFLMSYRNGQVWNEETLTMLVGLMIEALIAEAVTPIAATGRFANIQGFRFLKMVLRKVHWLENYAVEMLLNGMGE